MKNKITLVLILVVLLITGIFGYLYFTKWQNKESVTRAASSAKVQITAQGFVPETVIIKQGQSVEWVNADTKPHQLSPDPHPAHTLIPELAETDPIQSKELMSFQFNTKGTFTYHDELNPLSLKGTIIVE